MAREARQGWGCPQTAHSDGDRTQEASEEVGIRGSGNRGRAFDCCRLRNSGVS